MNKWEVSIIALDDNGRKYKVTKRIPEFNIAETKFFKHKYEAEQQIKLWLK